MASDIFPRLYLHASLFCKCIVLGLLRVLELDLSQSFVDKQLVEAYPHGLLYRASFPVGYNTENQPGARDRPVFSPVPPTPQNPLSFWALSPQSERKGRGPAQAYCT